MSVRVAASAETHRRQTVTGSVKLALRARRKFLRHFPGAFRDENYLDWERNYKATAHERWNAELDRKGLSALIEARRFEAIAAHAVRVESRTNLLFSFEKMALRDAVRSSRGAKSISLGLKNGSMGRAR